MTARRLTIVGVALAIAACQSPAEQVAPPAPPAVDGAALLRPTFETTAGTSSAGHAFLIEHGTKKVLLSAHHVLGVPGGLKKQIAWNEVPTAVTKVTARSATHSLASTKGLAIDGAKPLEPKDPSADLSAFLVEDTGGVPALKLATTAPRTGDFVWLFAEVTNYTAKDRSLHRASVSAATDKELRYIFADSDLKLQATSGAAVLNAKGEVVAVNLGGGKNVGLVFGVGNPVTSVRARLDKALAAP
jgi:hypothetical protein